MQRLSIIAIVTGLIVLIGLLLLLFFNMTAPPDVAVLGTFAAPVAFLLP
jgi:hypothetical protein